MNRHQSRGFRWHVAVIERHELGETTAPYVWDEAEAS